MKSAYQIIRRPVITEKGLAIKENQNTLVFQVEPKATKNGNQAGGAVDFQGESAFRAHRNVCGKRAAAWEVRGLPSGLEEGVCAAAGGREDAGVRAEFVRAVVGRRSLVVGRRGNELRTANNEELRA